MKSHMKIERRRNEVIIWEVYYGIDELEFYIYI